MNDDELWAAIDAQRLRTADLLDTLAPAQWSCASLCEGWTVRDVAAHLTQQQLGPASVLRAVVRHPGGLNSMIHSMARSRSGQPTERLVAEIRGMVGSRRHNLGVTAWETLLDIVIHGQDVAVPLGLPLEVPPSVAAAVADRAWSYRATRRGRKKARVFGALLPDGYRLSATDAPWAAGAGPEIRGPALALALLLTGRRAGLARLTGPGAGRLAAELRTS